MSQFSQFDFGPQSRKDDPITARLRFHQSWYRTVILKLPYGPGPKPGNKTLFGNMLLYEDGKRGANFLNISALQAVKERIGIKPGSINPFNITCNLLSQQALGFNLMIPFLENHALSNRLLEVLIDDQVDSLRRIMFIFSPGPAQTYLNDHTAFDVFITYRRPDGSRGFTGIIINPSDRPGQKAFINQNIRQWAEHTESPINRLDWKESSDPQVKRLFRAALLTFAIEQNQSDRYTHGSTVFLHHPIDKESAQTGVNFQNKHSRHGIFKVFSLLTILDRWENLLDGTTQRAWRDAFHLRYLDLGASEKEYRECNKLTQI